MRKLRANKFNSSIELVSAKLRATYNNDELLKVLAKETPKKRKKSKYYSQIVDASVYSTSMKDVIVDEALSLDENGKDVASVLRPGPVASKEQLAKLLSHHKNLSKNIPHQAAQLLNQIMEFASAKSIAFIRKLITDHIELTRIQLVLSIVFDKPNAFCDLFEKHFKTNLLTVSV